MKKKFIPVIALIFFIIDQVIKFLISNNMGIGQSITIIKNFLNITYVVNTGAAFSMLSGRQPFLIIIALVLLFGIYYYFIRNQELKKQEIMIYGILIGGILGNLVDRIFLNGVIDYLDFIILGIDAPIFNFADTCIVLSMLALVILELGGTKNEIQSK